MPVSVLLFYLQVGMEVQTVEAYKAGTIQFDGGRSNVQMKLQPTVVEVDQFR